MTNPSRKPEHIFVYPDHEPGSHQTNTSDAIIWWTPTLGPTATIAALLLSQHALDQPTTKLNIADLETMLGLGHVSGRCWRALNRLEAFRILTWQSTDTVTIRTRLPVLRPKQVERLPTSAAAMYAQMHEAA